MVEEIAPNRLLPGLASLRVAGARSRAKQGAVWPTPFFLPGCVPSLWARNWLDPSQAILPRVNGALTQFTPKGWSLTTAQRLAQLMHWHRAKRLLSHYPIGPNNLAGISRPGMDELKNRMCPLFEGTMLSPIRTVRLSVLQD
jgi:hypothetical protein